MRFATYFRLLLTTNIALYFLDAKNRWSKGKKFLDIGFGYRGIKIYDLLYRKIPHTFVVTEMQTTMKNRLATNIIIDLVMFLAMAVTSISGIVIKILAPLRRVAHEEWVREVASWFFAVWNRRTWAHIHLWAGVIVMVLLVVHIALHWQAVDGFFKKHIPNKGMRTSLYMVLFLLLVFSVVPWIWAF